MTRTATLGTCVDGSLLNFIVDTPTLVFANTGEVLAAGRSLWKRTVTAASPGAEGFSLDFANYGDPTG
jgi:hypothetical protein